MSQSLFLHLLLPWALLPTVLVGQGVVPRQAGAEPRQPPRQPPRTTAKQWPNYRGDATLHGRASGSIGNRLKLDWSFATQDAIISSPVVWDGIVYVGSSDQHLYAIDLSTGQQKWAFEAKGMIDCPPLVFGDRVYFGCEELFFYALDAKTGQLSWKYQTDDKIVGAANLVQTKDGRARIVVPGYDSKLYCFDPASGKKLWEYQTANFINATPAVFGDKIVFGGCDAVLHVVSATTGKALTTIELGSDCQVASSVAIADNKVYMGHYGNEFICVDLNSKKVVWKYVHPRQPFLSAPALAADRVVFGGRDKWLHCVKRSDGTKLWAFPTKRKVDGSPVICGDKVVFGSGDGRLYILGLSDGKELCHYEVGRPIYSSPAVVDGRIIIGCNDGRLYAFSTSKAPASASKQR